jgi:hypothetical protein
MNAVVEWLDSAEGQEWRDYRFQPVERVLAQIWPADMFSTHTNGQRVRAPDAAHDPCGRPPLAPEGAP